MGFKRGRWGLLLVNLGTPKMPETAPVRRYLREFLSDPRVLDINPVGRKALLELVILPRRPKKSAEAYRKVWTERGSPLLFHTEDLRDKLASRLGPDTPVVVAMRYQTPAIRDALRTLSEEGIDRVVVFPLFPHNASSSWGSAVARIYTEAATLWDVPSMCVVPPYYDHPAFISAFQGVASPVLEEFEPDFTLLSFHGLPERHVIKSDTTAGAHCLAKDDCCARIGLENRNCYRAQCVQTAHCLAERLDLPAERYEITFQSRLGRDPWLKPATAEAVRRLATGGVKRLAVLCPAFVSDCLETIEEIGIRANEEFVSLGGEALMLVPSLNSHDVWVDAVLRIIDKHFRLPHARLS